MDGNADGGKRPLTREERALLGGVCAFVAVVLAVSLVRWLWSSGSAPADVPVRVVATDKAPPADPDARGAERGTLVLAPDAPPPLPDEKLRAFLLVVADGDFADIALRGAELFRVGEVVPDPEHWLRDFTRMPSDGGAEVRYVLHAARDDDATRAIVLALDAATGEVRAYTVEVLDAAAAVPAARPGTGAAP